MSTRAAATARRTAGARGAAARGCLSALLLAAVAAYVAVHVAEPYLRFLQFRDAATQDARFAAVRSDSAIERHLWAVADSLGLPDGAYRLRIGRAGGVLRIRGGYDDSWQLFRFSRPVHFALRVEGQR